MENLAIFSALIYIAGVIGCAVAGDKRTCGLGGGLLYGLFCSPLVGALLILAYPSREEIAYYYWLKKQSEQKSAQ